MGIHDANIALIVTALTAKGREIVKADTDASGHTLHRSSLFKMEETNFTLTPGTRDGIAFGLWQGSAQRE
jgi:hypothetical protein